MDEILKNISIPQTNIFPSASKKELAINLYSLLNAPNNLYKGVVVFFLIYFASISEIKNMEQPLIGYIDLLLAPLYFIIFLLGARYIKKRNPDDLLIQKYFIKGFVFKIAGGLFYALLVIFYWGIGDTATYFKEVLEIRQLIAEGKVSFFQVYFYDYSYFRNNFDMQRSINNNGFMVTKIALFFSYFAFSRFLLTTMIFSCFAYASLFVLFKTFVSLIPNWHKVIALFVLFFPSISIYGSGILKDTICIAALGYFYYSSYEMLIKKRAQIKHFAIMGISAYFIMVVKSYILAAFMVPFIIFLMVKLISGIKPVFKFISIFLIFSFLISIGFIFSFSIEEALGRYSAENLQENIQDLQNEYSKMTENADSNFSIGAIDPTLWGLVKKMPEGFVATLYRPFIWEARKVFTMFSAIESLLILLFTLYVLLKAGFINFFKSIFTKSMIFLFIGFSLIFASLVGLSTLNFGTLARYRIPVIPFYLMGLLLILYRSKVATLKKPQ